MKKLFYVLLLVLGYHNLSAQQTKLIMVLNYSGKIDQFSTYTCLNITKGKDSVEGEYYYAKKGSANKISLSGIYAKNKLKLTESSYSIKSKKFITTGYFNLNFYNESSICSGTWQNSDKSKSLPVNLTLTENIKSSAMIDYTYNLIQYKGKYTAYNGDLNDANKIKGLQIFKNKVLQQTIIGFDEVIYDKNRAEVILQDLNFDGILDLKIPIYYPDRTKYDGSYLYFIYNPTTKKFIRNKILEDLEMVDFISADKTILKYDADGRGNEGTKYFKWVNKNLLLIKEERVFEDKPYTEISDYKIVNGKSVFIKKTRSK